MGFLKKLKDTTEKSLEKGVDLSKKGVDLGKQGVEKIDEIREEQKQADDKAIQEWLEPDEKILYSISQKRTSGGGVRPIKIVVTDKKIITKDHYLMKSVMNSYNWDQISRLEYIPSIMSYTLVISPYGADAVNIESLPKKEVEEIVNISGKFIKPLKKDSEPITKKQTDDPLSVLKKRLAEGEITIDEFKEMKELLE